MSIALIFGVSGQDGIILAKRLLSFGYKVIGVSRNQAIIRDSPDHPLNYCKDLILFDINYDSKHEITDCISTVRPTEIYYFAGQSSVGQSFLYPIETLSSNVIGITSVLEACKNLDYECKIYNACSSEAWGEIIPESSGGTEMSPFRPVSPYGIAKAASFQIVKYYRDSYGLFACSGITTNHESGFRSSKFVTQKIAKAAASAAKGQNITLTLGNLNIYRDRVGLKII